MIKQWLCFLGLVSLNSMTFAVELTGHWQTDHIFGVFDGEPFIREYRLKSVQSRSESAFVYGNNLVLQEGGQFRSFYKAPCGVDCFRSASGTYEMVDTDVVRFKVREVSVRGMTCRKMYQRDENIDMGDWVIQRVDGGLTLTSAVPASAPVED